MTFQLFKIDLFYSVWVGAEKRAPYTQSDVYAIYQDKKVSPSHWKHNSGNDPEKHGIARRSYPLWYDEKKTKELSFLCWTDPN